MFGLSITRFFLFRLCKCLFSPHRAFLLSFHSSVHSVILSDRQCIFILSLYLAFFLYCLIVHLYICLSSIFIAFLYVRTCMQKFSFDFIPSVITHPSRPSFKCRSYWRSTFSSIQNTSRRQTSKRQSVIFKRRLKVIIKRDLNVTVKRCFKRHDCALTNIKLKSYLIFWSFPISELLLCSNPIFARIF